MTILNEYLIYLNEDIESDCRKKHAHIKQKDNLLYRHQVASCIMWKASSMYKPYDKKMADLKDNYCKEDEIKKRKGVKILWDPLALRKCWKERDKKIEILNRKSEHLRKKYWEYNKKAKAIWKQIEERGVKRKK